MAQLKAKVLGLSKAKLEDLLFTLMDDFDSLNSEYCMLKDVCAELRKDIQDLEHENKILKSENIEHDMSTLVLQENYDKLKETLGLKEEIFAAELAKFGKDSLVLRQKAETLLAENKNLAEKLKQVETDFAANTVSYTHLTLPTKRIV